MRYQKKCVLNADINWRSRFCFETNAKTPIRSCIGIFGLSTRAKVNHSIRLFLFTSLCVAATQLSIVSYIFADSHVFDDSDDEFEDQYEESNRIIADLDKRNLRNIRSSENFKKALATSVAKERQRILQDEMERIYAEAKQLADEQLQQENEQIIVKPEIRRVRKELRRKITSDDELIVRFNDEMDDDDDEDDEENVIVHNDSHETEQDDDLYFVENENTFEVTKFEPRSPSGSQNYTVLDSGDVALSESVDYYEDENEMMMEEDSQHGECCNVVWPATVANSQSMIYAFDHFRFAERRISGGGIS